MELLKKQLELSVEEKRLYHELDKGIDDLENSRVVSHDDAMQQIRERLNHYAV